MMFSRNALAAAIMLGLVGCGGSDSASDIAQAAGPVAPDTAPPGHAGGNKVLPTGEGEVRVLSNRADLISGGDALVDVVIRDPQAARILLNDQDISSQFTVQGADTLRGLVTGLVLGENTLEVLLDNATSRLEKTITNHPKGGPVFSGPQVQPWNCTNAGAIDEQCNQPPEYRFKYVPAEKLSRLFTEFDPEDPGMPDAFLPYDPDHPPADDDIAMITTDEGIDMPFIVRVETGVINRDRYQVMSLYQPDGDWTALNPQSHWNGKVLVHHGGNVGVSYGMGSPPNGDISGLTNGNELLFGDSISVALARGFVTLSTAQANLGHNVNLVTAAESLMMAKEHIIENYGPVRYTIGTGCSGGAIAQQHIANAYPGIYQGLIVQCSYPDVWTTATQFADYNLISNYLGLQVPESPEGFLSFMGDLLTNTLLPVQWPFVYGHLPVNPVVSDLAFFPAAYPDQEECRRLQDGVPVYHPEENPAGLRCGLIDYMVNQFGERPPEVWSENEQLLGRGFAGLPLDNEGVQYGLRALQEGTISGAQFLDLNREIGGFNVDIKYQPERTRGDVQAITNAYRTGAINTTENLVGVPMIDLRGPDPGLAHDAFHSWQTRARIESVQGHSLNHVIWYGAFPIAGDTVFATEALLTMDQWLAGIETDERDDGLANKVVRNRPEFARDRCLSLSGATAEWGVVLPLTGGLIYPDPVLPGLEHLLAPRLPAEIGEILDVATGQVCGLDLGALGLPSLVTDLLSPITDPVVELQSLLVQTRFGTPRTVAGDDIRTLNNKCQLKPVDPADYPVNLLQGITNSENFAQKVAEIFPEGVCDYRKPPVGQGPTVTWMHYGDAREVVYGGAPLAEHGQPVAGWAAPAFEVTLSPNRLD
ncbi:DUF6351 family protein [Marinobacter halophilus]|uniref:DUF6351 domain-containing protein n=1 Tax=Marinobacter halophilus TaxID=1323740 RepID=A0A2T1KBV8_9GAMM|nr:DUF6351 family protein [Marinobacter halophilus]PSF07595.1 hypothetical protein C7H08_11895 [Marinobacter halophilus]